ncbi:hypothetical protein [Paraburkholderia dipogonis]|uniref:hypothetical protein n=1 Tax=Paraburkholderia dipogonis TaxID=1211383 RepID=UPI0038BA864A
MQSYLSAGVSRVFVSRRNVLKRVRPYGTFFALLLTSLLLSLASASVAWADAQKAASDWARFRAVYPLNMQTIALSAADAQGHRTMVVSEPPPDVTVDDIKDVSPLMSRLMIKTSRIGYNGQLTDVVVDLPPVSQPDVDSLVAALSSRLYGTSYKAYALPIAETPPNSRLSGIDVSLSSNQIWNWLIGDNREREAEAWTLKGVAGIVLTVLLGAALGYRLVRRRRFVLTAVWMVVCGSIVVGLIPDAGTPPSAGVVRLQSLEGGPPVTLQQVLDRGAVGVYASAERGFIVWCLAKDQDLAKSKAQARQFALDSDMVLGGAGFGNYVAIIGRERLNRVDALPPLRVETIMLVASADRNELAQSYERKFAWAGRVDQKRKLDWAPIYLSDQLIDTEYGSLLNVTDQMLKSWSMGGGVQYVNFRYASPTSFSSATPLLQDAVHKSSVTFNWNTKGAGYATQRGDFDVYALHRTGALPIDYLARDDSNMRNAEDVAYDWFSTLGDANLARVVQYAALYQLFVHYDIHAKAESEPQKPGANQLHEQTDGLIRWFLAIDFAAYANDSMDEDSRNEFARMSAAQSALRTYLQTATDAQKDALVDIIADPSTFRAAVGKDDEQTQKMIELSVKTSEAIALTLDSRARADAARIYIHAWDERPSNQWIRTPSIVLSSAQRLGSNITGGHNLSAAILEYQTDSTVARGTVKFVEENGRVVALYNEADRDGLPAVERIVGRDAGSRDPSLIERDVESAFKQAAQDTRSLNDTLHLTADAAQGGGRGMGGGHLPPGGSGGGWSFAPEPAGNPDSAFISAFATTQKDSGAAIPLIVSRDKNLNFAVHGPNGLFIQARNQPAVVDALRTLASEHPDGSLHLHFRDMDERSTRSLLHSTKLQDPEATDFRLIATRDGTMEPHAIQAVLETRYDWTKAAESVRISEPVTVGEQVAVDIEVTVPAVDSGASLLIRIRLYFKTLADAAKVHVEAISAMLKGIQTPGIFAASRTLRHDLYHVYGPLDDSSIHVIDKESKDFYMVDRSRLDVPDENERLA